MSTPQQAPPPPDYASRPRPSTQPEGPIPPQAAAFGSQQAAPFGHQQAPPPQRNSRLPGTAETLGWGGGLLTVVGVVAVTWDFWSQISGWALVGLLVLATGVLGIAAAVVGELSDAEDRDSLAENLSAALWWMTGIAGTVTTYVAISELSDGRTFLALLAASLASAAMHGAYYVRSGRDHALAGSILSVGMSVFSAARLASTAVETQALLILLVAAVIGCALSVYRPAHTRLSYGTVLVLLFGSSQALVVTGASAPFVVGAMLTVIVVAITAVMGRGTGEKVTASLLATLVTAEVAYDLAPEVFTLSTVILLVGVVMTSSCIWLVRRSRTA